jgi:hypothetical protein
MKKHNLLVLLFMPLLLLFYVSSGYGSSTSNDAVTNERPPLTADELAEHWNLDCHKIAVETVAIIKEGWAKKTMKSEHPDTSGLDLSLKELQLCAFIYNAKDTGRYQPCPNYEKALLATKEFAVSHKAKEFPALIESHLTSCGKE